MTLAGLANFTWLASSLPAWVRFVGALQRPAEVQAALLARLLARNSASAFGRAHGFSEIRDYAQFRERVPVCEYTGLEPWVARLMRGECSVLTAESPIRLMPTGGSTGGRKLIPFTPGFRRELNAAIGSWMIDLGRRHRGALSGQMYWSISPALPQDSTASHVPIGFEDDSAYFGALRRWCVEAAFAVPSAVRLAGDVETSRYVTLLCLLRARNLRLISVWHPSFLTLLLDALPACWNELLVDIERGGCSRAGSLPSLLQSAIDVAPQPRRAGELRANGWTDVRGVWPALCVVSCWAEAQSALPAAALQRRMPGVAIQSKGLLATEAVVTIPFAGAHPLAVTSHFYEFADGAGRICRADELRRGETYSVVVTTSAGLWRYRLGDLAEVNGLVGATPSLRFLGREGCVSDLCGEKLTAAFVARCVQRVSGGLNAAGAFAMLAPEMSEPPCYTLFFEGDMPAGLVEALDASLRANPHYALCRDIGQLGPVKLCVVRNADRIYCETYVAAGRKLGDIKPRSLSVRLDWRAIFSRGSA